MTIYLNDRIKNKEFWIMQALVLPALVALLIFSKGFADCKNTTDRQLNVLMI
jgi:hypothetical protein